MYFPHKSCAYITINIFIHGVRWKPTRNMSRAVFIPGQVFSYNNEVHASSVQRTGAACWKTSGHGGGVSGYECRVYYVILKGQSRLHVFGSHHNI